MFDTLRFAVPFDAFRTAETAGTPRQAGSTGALPGTEEPSDEAPLTPPAESLLPAAPPVDAFAPAPREAERPSEQLAEPFLPAEEPSAEADGDRAVEEPPAKTDTLVHPAAAAVRVPAPAASRRPGRKHTASRNTASRSTGRPYGENGAGRGRRGKGDRHYDWLWEVVGILICLIIALIVFFNVPTVFTP
ncbi:hypothetical protein [Microbispora sp. GKU 823]|uniref:hypothetical protein n=1 Tax=Microbispora sp. GKU 823 TaxID=1652100 RepID=UPI0009A423F4|nr:hypothetical protein [Microbispora sp. GKU 823]OPG09620.1 hypothetical protein B1L11_25350 [Microbispora sp. GKU 823]